MNKTIKDAIGNPQAHIREQANGGEILTDLSGSVVATYDASRGKTLDNVGRVIANGNRLLSLVPLD